MKYTNNILKRYTCHSGGAYGSDKEWGEIGKYLGVTVKHYYWMQKTPFGNIEISQEDYDEGYDKVLLANKKLKRRPEQYMNLLCRNWAQVKYSDSVFAIGILKDNYKEVDGGTGWAVQMAIDSGKSIFVYDINYNKWFKYNEKEQLFLTVNKMVILPTNFAGIGTRKITHQGKIAIREIYKQTALWNLKIKKMNL